MSAEHDVLNAEVSQPLLIDRVRGYVITVLSVVMCLFTLLENEQSPASWNLPRIQRRYLRHR